MNYINFGNQNPSLIFSYLSHYEEARRNEINQNAITHAIGWSGLFSGLAGKDSKPVKAEDLLPFPDLIKSEGAKVFTKKTFNTIIRLMKENRIPPQVLSFLHALPEIQQQMIRDDKR